MTRIFHSPALSALPHIRHGFFGRDGGVSTGVYTSLNGSYSSGDDTSHVTENRQRCLAALGLPDARLNTLQQTHSADVLTLDQPLNSQAPPEGDGLITAQPGLAIAAQTADCVPLLIADMYKPLIATVHAGWKGALAGIVDEAIDQLTAQGATALVVAIGPSIRAASYQVHDPFRDSWLAADADHAQYFAPHPFAEGYVFDLPQFIRHRLAAHNAVARIDDLGLDTYGSSAFFSYRRTCQAKQPDYGRQLSVIALAS